MSLAILFGTFLWYSDKKERYGPIPFLFVLALSQVSYFDFVSSK